MSKMELPRIPEFDWNYPTPENPPRDVREPFKFDENGICIKQPLHAVPAQTFVRLEFEEKVHLESQKEWRETLLAISREENWRETDIGRAVDQPHIVILIIYWGGQSPEAIRDHCVPDEPSIFSFAAIRHLLASEPGIVSIGSIGHSIAYRNELIIVRGPPHALSPSVLSGADKLGAVRAPHPHGFHEDYIGGCGNWALNNDPNAERSQVIILMWIDREKEARFKVSKYPSGKSVANLYNKYIGDFLKESQQKGATVYQMDIDIEKWYPPPPQKPFMKLSCDGCSIL